MKRGREEGEGGRRGREREGGGGGRRGREEREGGEGGRRGREEGEGGRDIPKFTHTLTHPHSPYEGPVVGFFLFSFTSVMVVL